MAEAPRNTYVATGTVLHVGGADDPAEVAALPPVEQSLLLHRGDLLALTNDCSAAPVHRGGALASVARCRRSSTMHG